VKTFDLPDLPDSFPTTRDHLHQIAFFAISPTRHKATGRMGLRHHDGGFGTPEFDGKVVRVEGGNLVAVIGDTPSAHPISTVREAIEFLGHEYEEEWYADFHDPLGPIHPDEKLDIDPASVQVLGEWFGFAWALLNELQTHGNEGDDVSEVQLWPEHFDAATELGSYDAGERASFGASPGDSAHAEPYTYVAAWSEIDRDNSYWNDTAFNGASMSYSELQAADDPVKAGLDFLLEGYRILHSG